MKTKLLIFSAAAALLLCHSLLAEKAVSALPDGMSGGFETLKGEILKVYSTEDQGARFRAYVVKWKEKEVIVSDPLGNTDRKVGETIVFMAHRLEMDHLGSKLKMLQFMIMDIPDMAIPPAESDSGSNR